MVARLVAMRVLLLALAASAVAAAPAAAADYTIVDYRQAEGTGAQIRAFVPYNPSGTSARLVLERGGALLADVSSNYNFVNVRTSSQPGDVVKLYSPKSAATPAVQYTADAQPAIDAVCIGKQTFNGTRTANSNVLGGYTYVPSFTGSGSGAINNGIVGTLAPDTFVVTLARPITAGEYAVVSQRVTIGNANVSTVTSRPAQNCPPPIVTPPVTADDARVLFDKARDAKVAKNGKSATFAIGCSKLSTVPCAGIALLRTDAKKPKKIGAKAFSIKPGTTQKVKVAFSKAAQRELKRKKRLKVQLKLSTLNQAGTTLAKTSKLTLKKPR